MKKYCAIFLMSVFCSCIGQTDKSKLGGSDYRLFEDTPVWELVQAIQRNDINRVRKLAASTHVDLNFREERFGQTLLMLTISNNQFTMCKELLTLGADPNVHDRYDGSSAIIKAAGVSTPRNDTTFIKLLLSYGANPNDEETVKVRDGKIGARTPLLSATKQSLAKVMVLVQAGADINYKSDRIVTPLNSSLIADRYDISLYLLKLGADFTIPVVHRPAKGSTEGLDVNIQNFLREQMFPLGSLHHELKMKIVGFLYSKGINYEKAPIPDVIVTKAKRQFPKTWEDYLSKY
jgi:hypothetical protein